MSEIIGPSFDPDGPGYEYRQPTRHTAAEIDEAARKFEQWADSLDPATTTAEDIEDLAAIADDAGARRRDEALIAQRVADARAHGRSWNRIAIALGVTRQAARQRFGGWDD